MKNCKNPARRLFVTSPLSLLVLGSGLMLGAGGPLFAYSITDLGVTQAVDIEPGGASFKAITINDNSNIATWTNNSGQYQGFLTATSTWLHPVIGDLWSVPLALDNATTPNVVGISRLNTSLSIYYQAVEWIAGSSTPTVLPIGNFVGTPDTSADPFGINSLGEIVGESYGASGGVLTTPGRAFLYSSGTTTFLPAPTNGNGTRACGINTYGQAVGAYYTEGPFSVDPLHPEVQQGVVWTPGAAGGSAFSYTLLGTGIGSFRTHTGPNDPTCAYAVNRDGLAVGYGFSTHHAFLWAPTTVNGSTSGTTPETLHDLGVLTTTTGETANAYAISSPTLVGGTGTATIVGNDYNPSTSTGKAVKWTVTYTINPTTHAITLGSISGPTDLNTTGPGTGGAYPGWSLQSATSVNSSNAIVGYGTLTVGTTTTTEAFSLN